MNFNVNWGLGAPVDVAGQVQAGIERGRQMKAQNALAQYAQNPTPDGLNALAQYDPQFVLRERERQNQLVATQQQEELQQRAASGDREAMYRLAGVNPDLWLKLDNRQRDTIKQSTQFMGQAVQDVGSRPEADRAAAWSQYVQAAEARGYDIPPDMEQYSPDALRRAATEFGVVQDLLKLWEPDYTPLPKDGYLEDTNPRTRYAPAPGMANAAPPASGGDGQRFADARQAGALVQSMGAQGFLSWQKQHNVPVLVNSPQEAAALPPGTLIRSPDGRTGVKR